MPRYLRPLFDPDEIFIRKLWPKPIHKMDAESCHLDHVSPMLGFDEQSEENGVQVSLPDAQVAGSFFGKNKDRICEGFYKPPC
jgi:hypothetical protein